MGQEDKAENKSRLVTTLEHANALTTGHWES